MITSFILNILFYMEIYLWAQWLLALNVWTSSFITDKPAKILITIL